jgi:hypothetical protein
MSKIALSGNASGTGTLTIAAPNTNSDRTLTLPDAAGTMFNQGNIVGTVSESSGVPTGSIIERGSNANGDYVKYADGTMLCWIETASTTTSAYRTVTFPATFSVEPAVTAIPRRTQADGVLGSITLGALTTTNCSTRIYWNAGSGSGMTERIQVMGRWF